MKICLAQTKSTKGDIPANFQKHLELIDLAIKYSADLIIFPELSITGYEPRMANELAIKQDDSRFDIFQEKSNLHQIVIGLGVPTRSKAGIRISMLIFQPNQTRQTYSKQHLHVDELPFFIKGEEERILKIKNNILIPAICYESLLPEHAAKAHDNGANIYFTSVAKSENGYQKASHHYPKIAKEHQMFVSMSNCIGHCDDFESVGKSSIWNNKGELVGQLNDSEEGILVFDTLTEEVIKKQGSL